MLQNTGMPSPKDAPSANQDTPGTTPPINAHAVNCQGKSSVSNVPAHHQKPNGMPPQKPAHAHQTPTVTTACHAQPQESGTMEPTPAIAHHQLASGMELNVSAQLENTDHHVLNAQPQDSGTPSATNVFAKSHSSGTERNVSVHNHTFCGKEDVLSAQMDTLGKTTNARPAHAPSRIWKLLKHESDRFIVLFKKSLFA